MYVKVSCKMWVVNIIANFCNCVEWLLSNRHYAENSAYIISFKIILITILSGKYYYYSSFTEEKNHTEEG